MVELGWCLGMLLAGQKSDHPQFFKADSLKDPTLGALEVTVLGGGGWVGSHPVFPRLILLAPIPCSPGLAVFLSH